MIYLVVAWCLDSTMAETPDSQSKKARTDVWEGDPEVTGQESELKRQQSCNVPVSWDGPEPEPQPVAEKTETELKAHNAAMYTALMLVPTMLAVVYQAMGRYAQLRAKTHAEYSAKDMLFLTKTGTLASINVLDPAHPYTKFGICKNKLLKLIAAPLGYLARLVDDQKPYNSDESTTGPNLFIVPENDSNLGNILLTEKEDARRILDYLKALCKTPAFIRQLLAMHCAKTDDQKMVAIYQKVIALSDKALLLAISIVFRFQLPGTGKPTEGEDDWQEILAGISLWMMHFQTSLEFSGVSLTEEEQQLVAEHQSKVKTSMQEADYANAFISVEQLEELLAAWN